MQQNMQSKGKIVVLLVVLAGVGVFAWAYMQEPALTQVQTEQALDASTFKQ